MLNKIYNHIISEIISEIKTNIYHSDVEGIGSCDVLNIEIRLNIRY